ncbi:UDP glucuronosyltransferase 5 family, polypeptide G1 [Pimephales promelas]|uniref:UDP glucuronosyltransferase 5 family, polypeptide G1 n=1 Tax=Pimephales promelas TaxID=90988 RepID=UPI0019555587|nr:UDP glucuronosyltransferase 5 family, polypeptide G1 [Pimephales promelas]XP_039515650.1 UDP glucuronosyltransferase 5 family, polypeptide G1 [Pimephales promelas]XP_039515651.1 UDP glucuronosyltransferase 5 family, polypeptide G1 [Pimephales promelas]KAG1959225.1 UDP glucuronosyltransferase 5 family, polypeptide G1 [Pimephales promelas]
MDLRSKQLSALTCLLFVSCCCHGGNILVVPEDGSHWVNMQFIMRNLHTHGHSLTVVRSSKSWYIQENSSLYNTITINPPEAEDVGPDWFKLLIERSLALQTMSPFVRFFEQQKYIANMLKVFHNGALQMISTILDDASLVERLRDAKFDLLVTDPAFPIGVLLANFLHLPLVYNVRWINAGDAHMQIAPSPPSYIPMYNSLFHDHMSFMQRTENFLRHLVSLLQERYIIVPIYSKLLERHFPPGTDLLSVQQSADIWLMRVDFVFDFPRPTMPNMVYIGGFQCQPAKALPEDLEEFMQSSGEHGVVVMSLGAVVGALPKTITEAIAAAFAEIPQKVVWSYHGERPSTLGNNTLLLEWFPQNDLLGHPKTRVFVSHGGTNGIFEAIYHGVPILALPILFDQFDNAVRLQVRGVARVLQVSTLTSQEFLEGLKDLLENPLYQSNIRKLSELHHDRPLSPLDSATFWIEYVMRHKGAAHLRSEANNLPWYSYHILDVLAFLLAFTAIALLTSVYVCKLLCCRKSIKKRKVD